MKTQTKELGKVSITCNGRWSNNKRYERLCIVYTNAGSSYISKKDVPEYIDIENEEYWQLIVKSTAINLPDGTVIDLSNYVTKTAIVEYLKGYITKEDFQNYVNSISETYATKNEINDIVIQYLTNNIKTINGESIIGNGNINIEGGVPIEGDFKTIVPFGGFDTMDTDIYDDIYVWSSDEEYPPEQIKFIGNKFMIKHSVKEFYDKWKGSDVYNEYDGNTAQGVRKDKIFLYDKSLYAWDKYKQDLSEIIPEQKGSSGDGGNTPNGAESVYTPTISEATGITNAIGSISTDMVLGDLKGKSISKIIEMMLIAETWYNPKYEHNINMSSIPTLVKVGSTVQFPNATAVWNANIIPNEGVPGNIKLSHEAQINDAPITWGADMNYTTSGMATFEVGYDYGGGYYTITSNLGNSKIIEVSENTGTLTASVDITYPWFINSIEQPLVKIGDSYTVTKILGGQPSIKVPFANSEITVQVDLGFGYMDVEWEESIDESNLGGAIDETVPYKVLTKPDSYSNEVPHKITIKLVK